MGVEGGGCDGRGAGAGGPDRRATYRFHAARPRPKAMTRTGISTAMAPQASAAVEEMASSAIAADAVTSTAMVRYVSATTCVKADRMFMPPSASKDSGSANTKTAL